MSPLLGKNEPTQLQLPWGSATEQRIAEAGDFFSPLLQDLSIKLDKMNPDLFRGETLSHPLIRDKNFESALLLSAKRFVAQAIQTWVRELVNTDEYSRLLAQTPKWFVALIEFELADNRWGFDSIPKREDGRLKLVEFEEDGPLRISQDYFFEAINTLYRWSNAPSPKALQRVNMFVSDLVRHNAQPNPAAEYPAMLKSFFSHAVKDQTTLIGIFLIELEVAFSRNHMELESKLYPPYIGFRVNPQQIVRLTEMASSPNNLNQIQEKPTNFESIFFTQLTILFKQLMDELIEILQEHDPDSIISESNYLTNSLKSQSTSEIDKHFGNFNYFADWEQLAKLVHQDKLDNSDLPQVLLYYALNRIKQVIGTRELVFKDAIKRSDTLEEISELVLVLGLAERLSTNPNFADFLLDRLVRVVESALEIHELEVRSERNQQSLSIRNLVINLKLACWGPFGQIPYFQDNYQDVPFFLRPILNINFDAIHIQTGDTQNGEPPVSINIKSFSNKSLLNRPQDSLEIEAIIQAFGLVAVLLQQKHGGNISVTDLNIPSNTSLDPYNPHRVVSAFSIFGSLDHHPGQRHIRNEVRYLMENLTVTIRDWAGNERRVRFTDDVYTQNPDNDDILIEIGESWQRLKDWIQLAYLIPS